MKVKHVISLHLLACAVLVFVGCAAQDPQLIRAITAWQKANPDREGDCVIYAMKRAHYYQSKQIEVRICRGWFKGKPHRWCEYWDELTGEWLVDDPAVWYVNPGYPSYAYKTADENDYVYRSGYGGSRRP